jgi:GntR family transcriptional regulator / MocR family aminotransferase
MAKTTSSFDLIIRERRPETSLFQWVYDEVRSAILDGRLKRGMRLPSTRELARRYGVSRGTVITAFEQLHAEGYLEGKVGRGTYVNTLLPEDFLHAKRGASTLDRARKFPPSLSQYAQRLGPTPDARGQPAHAFRAAEAALDAFPITLWAQIASRRLRGATRTLLADVDPRGYRLLREAVSNYLGTARGVRCTTEQVIIVAGIQQGLELTARLVLDPGAPVWVEDPCFFGVAAMFKALAAKIIPVPVDLDGLNVVEGQRRSDRAKLAYVTPAHQFPLGVTMSLDRRLALTDWARRTGGLIFEDDYDSEYRYSGRPIPALQGLDQSDSVIFAGSFSKVLFPSLRLGYLVAPTRLIDKFAAARYLMDRHSAVIDQAILCDFITEGHFGRHIRRMRELYASRLTVLRESVQRRLGEFLTIPETEAGVNIVGWLGKGLSAEAVARAAAERNVEVIPINRFALKKHRPEGLLLGFGAVGDRELLRGVEVLADAVEKCAGTRHRTVAVSGA